MLRAVVFPALRLVVWSVIAVSLAWLAFGRTDPVPDTTATPSFEAATPEVTVTRGTVENAVSLPGSVSADAPVAVKATVDGRVSRLRARVDDVVQKGAPLLDIVTETPADPPSGPAADPAAPAPPPRAPVRKTTVVRAATAGTVTAVDVLVDQQVAVGDTVASVGPGTLTVTASLTQQQQFRLLEAPNEAQVSVPGGPAPFRCTELRIGQPKTDQPPAAPDPFSPAPPAGPATGSVTCRVPPDATVFSGMSATMELEAGVADNVLVLPVTAVKGSVSTGTVWRLGAGGEPTEQAVELGLTDGEQVEVRSGLAEGDQVLQFVPNSDEPVGGPGGGPAGMYVGGPGG